MNNQRYPQRKSPRKRGYDYSQSGAYFVTICTYNRARLFGKIVNDEMQLNDIGRIAEASWGEIPHHFAGVELDCYVVMPNHVHGIILINDDNLLRDGHDGSRNGHDVSCSYGNGDVGTPYMASAPDAPPHPKHPTLGVIVGTYKATVTRRVNQQLGISGENIWQGRYHDHIIRNEPSWNKIREYVIYNPMRWREDRFFAEE